ncbi:hypothetical protein GGR42_001887 [Saonia flava]|uniref:Probable membrane transporter protein n=1 Tax=Saonia flava TaxID=523696 RepID=A0A846R0H5_9FLAO|nr:sulfite exporter TauE/SafE family protein [Saonia flava]NJB71425.1 hypothetical protein [Saonia flava]
MEISITSWVLAFIAAFVIGVSKAGLKGIAIIIVTLMTFAFGAKESTGLIVPMLIVGDIFAVVYYNRHTQWKHIVRFLPWMMSGVVIGVFIGKDMPEQTFKVCMAIIILISVITMFWWDKRPSKTVPNHWTFAGFTGVMAGITTMIGNLAGAFSNIYFLVMRLPKNEFIGTAAWLFLFINIFKLPFHIFIWKTITPDTLMVNLRLIPGVFLGLFFGIKLVHVIQDKLYRKLILGLTALGALLILFR